MMDIDETYLDNLTKHQMKWYFATVKKNPYFRYKPYKKQSVPLLYCLEQEHDNNVHSFLLGGSGYSAVKLL